MVTSHTQLRTVVDRSFPDEIRVVTTFSDGTVATTTHTRCVIDSHGNPSYVDYADTGVQHGPCSRSHVAKPQAAGTTVDYSPADTVLAAAQLARPAGQVGYHSGSLAAELHLLSLELRSGRADVRDRAMRALRTLRLPLLLSGREDVAALVAQATRGIEIA